MSLIHSLVIILSFQFLNAYAQDQISRLPSQAGVTQFAVGYDNAAIASEGMLFGNYARNMDPPIPPERLEHLRSVWQRTVFTAVADPNVSAAQMIDSFRGLPERLPEEDQRDLLRLIHALQAGMTSKPVRYMVAGDQTFLLDGHHRSTSLGRANDFLSAVSEVDEFKPIVKSTLEPLGRYTNGRVVLQELVGDVTRRVGNDLCPTGRCSRELIVRTLLEDGNGVWATEAQNRQAERVRSLLALPSDQLTQADRVYVNTALTLLSESFFDEAGEIISPSRVTNSPMRSFTGNYFFSHGIDSDHLINYAEFHFRDRLFSEVGEETIKENYPKLYQVLTITQEEINAQRIDINTLLSQAANDMNQLTGLNQNVAIAITNMIDSHIFGEASIFHAAYYNRYLQACAQESSTACRTVRQGLSPAQAEMYGRWKGAGLSSQKVGENIADVWKKLPDESFRKMFKLSCGSL